MGFIVSAILSFCIILPVIAGLVRYKKINKAYYPFIYCICVGLVNETLNLCLVMTGHYNIVNSNIYMLIEAYLLLWQFKRWRLFQRNSILFISIIAGLLIVWVLENFIIFRITHYSSYFLITYSFTISLLSIVIINRLIVTERKKLIRNPVFILCVAFVIYYTVSVLSEAFWIYGIYENADFAAKVHQISVVTNFIAILLYTVAIIWMPSKQKFTMPSS